jgi:stage II sporulation protein D
MTPLWLLLAVGLLVTRVPAVSAQRPSASGTIRVAIAERVPLVELRGGQIEILGLASCCHLESARADALRGGLAGGADLVRVIPYGPGLEVDGRRGPAFRLVSAQPIRWNGRDYGGPIEVVRAGEGIAVINEVPLEDYLVGVLRAEAGERWPPAALRAQAIVARTYAAYHRLIAASKPYHIVASTAHQQYAGRVLPTSPLWSAVNETAGQVLHWEGELFPAFYHTESGGYTEDPRTVFAARNMPGLRPIRCEFSTGSPHFYWSLDLRLADLTELLRRHDVAIGGVSAIEVSERTPSLRAAWVTLRGPRGSVRLRGNDLRRIVGYEVLKSTLFAVAVNGDVARFAGRGYGHGVGMCQWGAKGMAEQGYSARQILDFYYPGTTPGSINGR